VMHDPDNSPPSGRRDARFYLHLADRELAEYELPEWLAAEQEAQREREANDRAKIGIAVLVVLLSGLIAISAIANYAGAA